MKLSRIFSQTFQNTDKSRFKKPHFFFLKSDYIWFKKGLFNEPQNWEAQKKCLVLLREIASWDLS